MSAAEYRVQADRDGTLKLLCLREHCPDPTIDQLDGGVGVSLELTEIDRMWRTHLAEHHDQCLYGMLDGWGHNGGPDCHLAPEVVAPVAPKPASKFTISPLGGDGLLLQCDGLRCSPDSVTFDANGPGWEWPTLEQLNRAAREHLEREHGFTA